MDLNWMNQLTKEVSKADEICNIQRSTDRPVVQLSIPGYAFVTTGISSTPKKVHGGLRLHLSGDIIVMHGNIVNSESILVGSMHFSFTRLELMLGGYAIVEHTFNALYAHNEQELMLLRLKFNPT